MRGVDPKYLPGQYVRIVRDSWTVSKGRGFADSYEGRIGRISSYKSINGRDIVYNIKFVDKEDKVFYEGWITSVSDEIGYTSEVVES